jgi:hypothetical protein
MYALIRRLTLGQPGSVLGGLVGGLCFAYGGYLTGYPQLQLAVLESGIWLPLALLGIHEATRNERAGWRWFGLSGLALALSLLAGHPQTVLFFMVCSAAYLVYRVVSQGRPWPVLVIGLAIFGLVGDGLAAVQLLPGWEYLGLTTRAGLGFDALGNGFPFYDVLQMAFPGFLSLWSPLYFGVAGLALALYGVVRRLPGSLFWLAVALFALIMSFGRGTALYDLFYNLAPGFSLFRGQERAAYLVAVSASILAGLGAAAIFQSAPPRGYSLALWAAAGLMSVLVAVLFLHWLTTPGADSKRLALAAFSLFVAVPLAALLTTANGQGIGWRSAALVGLVVFELFSFGRTNPNLESKPTGDRLQLPPLVKRLQDDTSGPFRVDGTRGLRENYGTLYGVMDIQGTSPLRLASIDKLLKLPNQGRPGSAGALRSDRPDGAGRGISRRQRQRSARRGEHDSARFAASLRPAGLQNLDRSRRRRRTGLLQRTGLPVGQHSHSAGRSRRQIAGLRARRGTSRGYPLHAGIDPAPRQHADRRHPGHRTALLPRLDGNGGRSTGDIATRGYCSDGSGRPAWRSHATIGLSAAFVCHRRADLARHARSGRPGRLVRPCATRYRFPSRCSSINYNAASAVIHAWPRH